MISSPCLAKFHYQPDKHPPPHSIPMISPVFGARLKWSWAIGKGDLPFICPIRDELSRLVDVIFIHKLELSCSKPT